MSDDEREIRDLVATWMATTREGDYAKVLELMTDDAVFLQPGRPPMVGKAAFAAALEPPPGRARPAFEGRSAVREVRVIGEWAFMWTELTVVATPPGGEPVTRSGHTLSVLRKEGGRWKLARDANMLAPATPVR